MHVRSPAHEPDRYLDPISLGALIVSVASLVWTVYTDLKQKTANPSPDGLARTIRVQLQDAGRLDEAERDRVIDVIVSETLDHRGQVNAALGQPHSRVQRTSNIL